MFDWTIRIGDVLQIIALFGVAAGFFFGLRQRIALVAQRLGFLEETYRRETDSQNTKIDLQSEEIGKLGDMLVSMARYEERMRRQDDQITLLSKQVEDLRHGQGFINGPRLANAGNN